MTLLETSLLCLLSALLCGLCVSAFFCTRKPKAAVPVAFVRQWKPLSAAQIAQAFQGWDETDTRWRAQWDLLTAELEGALTDIAQTKSTPADLARWAGRIEMVMHWRAQLLALRRRPEAE